MKQTYEAACVGIDPVRGGNKVYPRTPNKPPNRPSRPTQAHMCAPHAAGLVCPVCWRVQADTAERSQKHA